MLHLNTLRIRGFDPASASDVASASAVARVYEGLVQVAYLDRPYRVEPLLAAAMPEVSSDGLVYTFPLRPGIRFQDDACFPGGAGREVTAEDFIYSFKRLADAKTASTGWWILDGRIAGLNAFREASRGAGPTEYARTVEGLSAPDPYTLRIQLTAPYPQLLWVLALTYASVVPREAVAHYGDRFAAHPVGTGPYRLEGWKRNYSIRFARNPAWGAGRREDRYPANGGADAGRLLPLIERIECHVVADAATQWMLFLRGALDLSDIARDNWDAVMGLDGALRGEVAARGVVHAASPQLRIGYIGINLDDPVLGRNVVLRRAMACAFNTAEWERLHQGRVRRPNSPIPRMLDGWEEDYDPWAFDLARARALLAEAGYPEGRDPATGRRLVLTLELGRADDLELRQAAELFVAFMERIGIVVELSLNNGPAFYQKIERRQAQLFFLSWLGDYPDAENFLQCFYGPNASPGPNRANYVNPSFDRLFERVRAMQPSDERTALYRELARMVIDDVPWLLASEPVAHTLRQARLANHEPHLFPFGVEKYYRLSGAEAGP